MRSGGLIQYLDKIFVRWSKSWSKIAFLRWRTNEQMNEHSLSQRRDNASKKHWLNAAIATWVSTNNAALGPDEHQCCISRNWMSDCGISRESHSLEVSASSLARCGSRSRQCRRKKIRTRCFKGSGLLLIDRISLEQKKERKLTRAPSKSPPKSPSKSP